jgi:hypothetical protein
MWDQIKDKSWFYAANNWGNGKITTWGKGLANSWSTAQSIFITPSITNTW